MKSAQFVRPSQSARRLFSKVFMPTTRNRVLLSAFVVFVTLSAILWQTGAAASSPANAEPTLLQQVSGKLRAALGLITPWQGGVGSRTVISTIAGGGFSTNAPARQAPMVMPTAVARDPQNRGVYVVDEVNGTSLLRFLNTTGQPVTLAGTTIQPGSINLIAGGGSVAETTNVRDVDLTLVSGIVVDPTGDVIYLTTPIAAAIRAINVGSTDFRILNKTITPGTIANIFNINRSDFRAITMNAAREFFYISVTPTGGARVVYKLDNAGQETIYAGGGAPQFGNGDGGQAIQAKLTLPMGLALDSNGNLFIAEGGDNRGNPGAVRKVEPSGFISSLVTNLEFPTGITLGPNNSFYVAVGNAQQVLRITSSGAKTLVAGASTVAACDPVSTPTCGDGGSATQAFLNLPGSTQLRTVVLAADASGFFLPDHTFMRVRYVNVSGAPLTIAGTTIGGGQINTVIGSGQDVPYDNVAAINSELSAPTGVAADANGNLFVMDTAANPVSRLRFINRGTTPVTLFAGTPAEVTVQPGNITTLNYKAGELVSDDSIITAVFASPQGLAVTAKGVYIVDSQYGALIRPPGSLTGRRSGHIRFLNTSNTDVTIFPSGGNAKVVIPPGQIKDVVGRNDAPVAGAPTADDAPANTAIIFPTDVAVDAAGNLFIADQGNNRIRKVNASTGQVTSVLVPGSEGLTPLLTSAATGVALGADGRLYIADTRNDRVLRQDAANGNTFTVIANNTKGISRPRDLALDAAGNVYVTNAGTDQIVRIQAPTNALGTTAIVAGNGQAGFSGDGGPANRARLNLPNPGTTANDVQLTTNIITLANGDILFTDTENNRLRLLVQQPNQAPVLAALNTANVDEGQNLTVNITATDGNGDPLTITTSALPNFASFTDNGDSTAKLLLSPGFTSAGTYNVTVSVTDGDASDSKSFSIVVKDVNRPPVVNVTPVSPSYEATGPNGRSVNLLGTASDPDGDALTYKWFDSGAQIADVLTPQVQLSIGSHSLFLTATDSRGASTSSPAQAVIVQDKTPPVISNVPADITVQATGDDGVTVNFTLPTATDIVDGAIRVNSSKSPGSLFPVGVTTVEFTAADMRGNTSTASFKVTVTPKAGGGGGGGGGGNTPGSYTISSFAGSGDYGYSGNGGAALSATFKQLNGLGVSGGNLLIVDGQSRVVRVVDAQNKINSFAGNSSSGNVGDGSAAIYASFGQTGGVVSDANGNTYVSDTQFHRIRKVLSDGRIVHFAGTTNGQSGSAGDNGQAGAARLNRPTGLAIDAQGNLYICDSGNHRIRRIDISTNIITTVAGNGGAGFGGDAVLATHTSLNNPTGLAVDGQGNLYIADRGNQRIRKVDASSKVISTIAGTGDAGFGGDNGAGTAALLNNPNDIAIDKAGNLYIADQNNHRVRRITANGVIATIAGTGIAGYSGEGNAATQAQFNFPVSVIVAGDGSVFVGDNGNLRVRKLTPTGGGGTTNHNPVITSPLGNQTLTKGQTLDVPLTATDEDGDSVSFALVNAPSFASIVNANPAQRTATLRLAPSATGTFNNVQVKADDGKGGVTLSSEFNIFVNEQQPGNRPPTASAGALPAMIEAVSAAGAPVNLTGSGSDPDNDAITFSWTDNGVAIAASANATVTLAIGNHSLVLTVTDSKGAKTSTAAQAVTVKDSTPPVINNVPAAITTAATSPSGALVNYAMPTATDIVDGAVTVVADKASGTLFAVGTTTVKFTATDARGNAAQASFNVTVTPFSGGGTAASYNISTYAGSGDYGFAGDNGPATSAPLRGANGLRRSETGLLVVDGQSRVVRRVDAQGVIRTVAGNSSGGNTGDGGLAIYASLGTTGGAVADASGNVYVADTTNHRIRRVTTDGRIAHFAGTTNALSGSQGDNGQAAAARLNRPTALAIDGQGNLYICDSGNHRIRMVNLTTNIITTVAGNGGAGYGGDGVTATTTSLNNPTGIALDAQGNLYIADRGNHRIRRVDAVSKQISTIAGDGTAAYGGDNGPATGAQFNNPNDVAVDALGNVYVADQNNHRVRRFTVGGAIITIAGTGTTGFSGDGGAALQAQLSYPLSVEVLTDGSVYVGDNGNLRVRKLTPATPPPPANKLPVITSAINNQTLTKGQTVLLALSATDEDGDSVSFSLVNAPSFATIINANPAQRSATLQLAPTAAGTFNGVQIKADDGKGGTATSAAFNITVNEPPQNVCQATVAATRWRGEYFNNRDFSGNPALVRDDGDGALNLSFGEASPSSACGLLADQFSARFTRDVELQGGVYRFSLFGDDGVRLYIDGQLKINQWQDQAETRFDVDVAIAPGVHKLRVEYYDNVGSGAVRLFWNALNYFPIINTIPNVTVTRGQSVMVDVTASDSDNDPVTFSLNNAPLFITLIKADPAQRKVTLLIEPPAFGTEQQFTPSLNADDGRGGKGVSNTFTVSVTNVPPPPANKAPVAKANELPATVTAADDTGAVIALDATGSSDPDGDTLTYSWTDFGTVIATTATASVKLPIGTHAIALTVNDGKGGVNSTAAQTVTVNAPPPPQPTGPTITSVSPSFGRRGNTIVATVTGSGFVPGATVTIGGAGITTTTTYISATQLSVRLVISGAAFTNARSVTVVNPNGGGTANLVNGFSVYP